MIDNTKVILLIEDDKKISRGLFDILKLNKYEVITAFDGEEGIDLFYKNQNNVDLILLDIMMPKKNGFEVLEEIREVSQIPIIMLTAKDDEISEMSGFRLGVDDYVPKPFSITLLLYRIEAVLRRVGKSTTDVTNYGNMTVSAAAREVKINGINIDLPPKLFDLLQYFLCNINVVVSREQILNNCWEYDFDGEIRTVDVSITRLREKIKNSTCKILTVPKIGYKFEVD